MGPALLAPPPPFGLGPQGVSFSSWVMTGTRAPSAPRQTRGCCVARPPLSRAGRALACQVAGGKPAAAAARGGLARRLDDPPAAVSNALVHALFTSSVDLPHPFSGSVLELPGHGGGAATMTSSASQTLHPGRGPIHEPSRSPELPPQRRTRRRAAAHLPSIPPGPPQRAASACAWSASAAGGAAWPTTSRPTTGTPWPPSGPARPASTSTSRSRSRTTSSEGRLMVEAARKHKRVVQVGTQSRSVPHSSRRSRTLRDGQARQGPRRPRPGTASSRRRQAVKDERGAEGLDYDLWQGPAPERPYNDNRCTYGWRWWRLRHRRHGQRRRPRPRHRPLGPGRRRTRDGQLHRRQALLRRRPGVARHADRDVRPSPATKAVLVYEQRLWSPYFQEGYENGVAFYGTEGYMILGRRRLEGRRAAATRWSSTSRRTAPTCRTWRTSSTASRAASGRPATSRTATARRCWPTWATSLTTPASSSGRPRKRSTSLSPTSCPAASRCRSSTTATRSSTRSNKKKADWFTTNGDVFPVGKSKMKPFPPTRPTAAAASRARAQQGRRRVEPLLHPRDQRRGAAVGQRRGGLRRQRLSSRNGLPVPGVGGVLLVALGRGHLLALISPPAASRPPGRGTAGRGRPLIVGS